jgi:hypothetical protein
MLRIRQNSGHYFMTLFCDSGVKDVTPTGTVETNQPSLSSCVQQALNDASGIVYMCSEDCLEAGVLIDDSEPLETLDLIALAIRLKDELEHRPREYDEVARIACDLLMLALFHRKASAQAHEMLFAQLSRLSAEICDAGLLDEIWRQSIQPLAALSLPEGVTANWGHVPSNFDEDANSWVEEEIPAYLVPNGRYVKPDDPSTPLNCASAEMPDYSILLPMNESGHFFDHDERGIRTYSKPDVPIEGLSPEEIEDLKITVKFRQQVLGWTKGWPEKFDDVSAER